MGLAEGAADVGVPDGADEEGKEVEGLAEGDVEVGLVGEEEVGANEVGEYV